MSRLKTDAIRNVNASVDGITLDTSGNVAIPNELQLADKIVHTGDTNTALRFPAADTIQLETGGTNRLKIDANGVVQVTRRLELTNSGDNHAVYEGRAWTWTNNGTASGTVRAYMYGDSSSNLRIGTNGWNERLRIGSTGDFGLGTTNTDGHADHTNLFIGAMGNIYAETSASSSNSTAWSNNAYNASSGGWKYRSGGKVSNIYQYDGKIGFRTAGTGSAGDAITWAERFTIEDNHNIYIWGAQTGNNRAILYNGAGYFGIYGSSNNSTNRELRFHTGGGSSTEVARFSTGGKLSIGSVAAANIAAQRGIEISGGTTSELRLKNSGGGTGQADGFAIQKWNNGNNYIYDYDSNNILFGTGNLSRTQMDTQGRWCFSPSGAPTSGSSGFTMSLIHAGNSGSSGVYPGIAIKSTATGGGDGMAIHAFDGSWDLYTRSGNRDGISISNDAMNAASGNSRVCIGGDGAVTIGKTVYNHLATSRYCHSALHIAGGSLSIGGIGNGTNANRAGVYTLGWYITTHSNSSYYHIKTDLWAGGSPHGNNAYIMGGFRIEGYSYSSPTGSSTAWIQFHNWSGSYPGLSVKQHYHNWDMGPAVYTSSDGYVVLRLNGGTYKSHVIDLIQHVHYPSRNIGVQSFAQNNNATHF